MIKINRREKNALLKLGVNIGEDGIISSVHHRKTSYYLTESENNIKLFTDYIESIKKVK